MKYPQLKPTKQSRLSISSFPGYDHRLRAKAGTVFEAENLSTRRYPLLSPRAKRGYMALPKLQGIIAKDALCYVQDGRLYLNHQPTALTGLSAGEKQLVSMGAYVLIFPDKLYYNTAEPNDYGSMEAAFDYSGSLRYAMCDANGVEFTEIANSEPAQPKNAQLWLSDGVLYEYSEAAAIWVQHETVYTRLSFSTTGEIPRLFNQYDGVSIAGLKLPDLNGEKIIHALGGSDTEQDYIVLVGICENAFTDEAAELTIRRDVPDMDFVCQCQNRLWGCRYGNDGERNLNEIYASALGDFKNFHQFMGLSTDSWAASLGSDGVFTGAVSYLDSPCFFKADRIHRVSVSPIGAHRISETACRGVQQGSHKSLAVVGESLFYKSDADICQWQGGFPTVVSAPLGERRYKNAVAGSSAGQYFISMQDEQDVWQLFVYDSRLHLWQRQDALHALAFASRGNELYCIDADNERLLEMSGNSTNLTPEEDFAWYAQTGVQDFETPQRKYLSRYKLSLGMTEGAKVALYLRYDSEGEWEKAGELEMKQRAAVLLPVRPRRCQHLELRIEGRGDVTLYAIDAIYEEGSDI